MWYLTAHEGIRLDLWGAYAVLLIFTPLSPGLLSRFCKLPQLPYQERDFPFQLSVYQNQPRPQWTECNIKCVGIMGFQLDCHRTINQSINQPQNRNISLEKSRKISFPLKLSGLIYIEHCLGLRELPSSWMLGLTTDLAYEVLYIEKFLKTSRSLYSFKERFSPWYVCLYNQDRKRASKYYIYLSVTVRHVVKNNIFRVRGNVKIVW